MTEHRHHSLIEMSHCKECSEKAHEVSHSEESLAREERTASEKGHDRPKRKLNIPIESQIRGIKKALANPKTPAQLKRGMEKRLAKLEGQQ